MHTILTIFTTLCIIAFVATAASKPRVESGVGPLIDTIDINELDAAQTFEFDPNPAAANIMLTGQWRLSARHIGEDFGDCCNIGIVTILAKLRITADGSIWDHELRWRDFAQATPDGTLFTLSNLPPLKAGLSLNAFPETVTVELIGLHASGFPSQYQSAGEGQWRIDEMLGFEGSLSVIPVKRRPP